MIMYCIVVLLWLWCVVICWLRFCSVNWSSVLCLVYVRWFRLKVVMC